MAAPNPLMLPPGAMPGPMGPMPMPGPMPPPGVMGPMPAMPPMGGMPMGGGMPGGLPPGGMPPGGGDPFSAVGPTPLIAALLSDPELLSALLGPQALPRDRRKWQEPPKPTEGDMLAKARQDQSRLTTLARRFADNNERIDMEKVGVFDDYDPEAEQVWRSNGLLIEDQMIASIVGTIPPAFESPKRRPVDQDEAQAKEDFLAFLHDEHRRQHNRAGFGDLDMELVKHITRYGRAVTRNICCFDAPKGAAPFRMKLIDPSIFWPTFAGDRGMVRATLIYQQSVGDFIGDHDEDGSVEKAVMGLQNDRGETYDWNDLIEVIEYWDCKWSGVFAAGKLVKGPDAHDYGEPPFVFTLAPYGAPSSTRRPDRRQINGRNGVTLSAEDADAATRGLSHFHTRFTAHEQREAIFGRLYTKLSQWGNEPLWVKTDSMFEGQERPNWSRAAGAFNEVPDGMQLLPSPEPPVPPQLNALLAASNEDVSRDGLSPAEYGLTPSAQQSGYAIAGLSEAGKQKLSPVIITKQTHHAMVGEQRLRFYRDWGHLLGDEGARGSIVFPRVTPDPKPGAETTWEVTPEMIDRTGWQVSCRLIDMPDITSLGAMANAFALLKQQGAITRRDTIRLTGLPGSRNPDQTMREIDVEMLKEAPEYKLAHLLKYVVEEENDPDLANVILMMLNREKAKNAPPPPQGGPGGGSPAQLPGQSLPGLGMPPGTEGGRPPQGPQGQPITGPQGPPPGPGSEF